MMYERIRNKRAVAQGRSLGAAGRGGRALAQARVVQADTSPRIWLAMLALGGAGLLGLAALMVFGAA